MPTLQVATLDAIRDPIVNILRTSDLASISAKKVRLALAEQNDPRFPSQKLLQRLQVNLADKEHKRDVDDLIRQCFESVNNGGSNGSAAAPTANGYSNGASPAPASGGPPRIALPGLGGIPGSDPAAGASKPAPAPSSSQASSSAGAPKRSRKSDVISDDEEDIDPEELKAKAKKQASKPKKKRKSAANDDDREKPPPNPNNPFNKPLVLSDELSSVCGGKEMPRYTITKKLWEYIKGHDLQDPQNKRKIICDATLKSLFGKEYVDSFEMAKLIKPHVSNKTE